MKIVLLPVAPASFLSCWEENVKCMWLVARAAILGEACGLLVLYA